MLNLLILLIGVYSTSNNINFTTFEIISKSSINLNSAAFYTPISGLNRRNVQGWRAE